MSILSIILKGKLSLEHGYGLCLFNLYNEDKGITGGAS